MSTSKPVKGIGETQAGQLAAFMLSRSRTTEQLESRLIPQQHYIIVNKKSFQWKEN